MAYDPNSQDDEDIRRRAQAPGGSVTTGAAQTAVSSPSAPSSPSNFVSFDRYFGANAGAAQRTAQNTANQVGRDAQNALMAEKQAKAEHIGNVETNAGQTADGSPVPGWQDQVTKAQSEVGATKDYAGLQALLANQQNTNSSYNAGMNRFDAALTGMAGRQSFENLRKQYAGLDNAFNDYNAPVTPGVQSRQVPAGTDQNAGLPADPSQPAPPSSAPAPRQTGGSQYGQDDDETALDLRRQRRHGG